MQFSTIIERIDDLLQEIDQIKKQHSFVSLGENGQLNVVFSSLKSKSRAFVNFKINLGYPFSRIKILNMAGPKQNEINHIIDNYQVGYNSLTNVCNQIAKKFN
ncbi:kinetochore scaffold 1 [Anaeramoeba flamelloides]|uniref:Kinetochore scaffold 1 n=1 Tax=Anaeramoeba flamelloides TaxID=1746091 RepID=A0ABQ8XTJ0_9EUKA|nr:kinetochore scaffold 1 [Anaeramoeba flamelloides]